MKSIAVVYWSQTGNTEAMANYLVDGLQNVGATVSLFNVNEFAIDQFDGFDAIAFGCPAMGAEVLEEMEFQPMWDEVSNLIADKKIALFGSYDWGDGEWMRNWAQDALDKGAILVAEPVIANLTPEAEAIEQLLALAEALVN